MTGDMTIRYELGGGLRSKAWQTKRISRLQVVYEYTVLYYAEGKSTIDVERMRCDDIFEYMRAMVAKRDAESEQSLKVLRLFSPSASLSVARTGE